MTNSGSDHDDQLSSLYRQTEPDGPGEMTDARILAEARHAVKRPERTSAARKYNWIMPAGIAATVAIAAIISVIMLEPAKTPLQPGVENDSVHIGTTQPSPPRRQLDRISLLIKENRIDEARSALADFRKLYPDYRINAKKYPTVVELEAQSQ